MFVFFFVADIKKIMSSKKNILSTIKQFKKKTKTSVPTLFQDIPNNNIENRIQLFEQLKLDLIDLSNPSIPISAIDHIKIYISSFPHDSIFHRLLNLSTLQLSECIEFILTNKTEDPIKSFQIFLKNLEKTISKSTSDTFLMTLSSSSSFDSIPFLSERFYFDSDKYDFNSFKKYIIEYCNEHPNFTNADLSHVIHTWKYDHRFDYILHILQDPTISSSDKQHYTIQHLHSIYESSQSLTFFNLIMTIIDEKISSFQSHIDKLLFRFIPDKKAQTHFKKNLTIILDIVINNISKKQLLKYFISKKSYDHFLETKYSYIQTNYSKIIHDMVINEIDQPFLYKYAYKISWEKYLSLIQKPLISTSIEIFLYEIIQKNTSERLQILLDTIKKYLLSPCSQQEIKHIHSLLRQYISTLSPKFQSKLQKLFQFTLSDLYSFLSTTATNDYISMLHNLDPLISNTTISPDIPTSFDLNFVRNLHILRPNIPDFDHVEISPIDDINIYIHSSSSSNTFFIPNDLFFTHLADPNISKTQLKNIFVLNNLKLKLANVSIFNEYIIQNETTYQNLEKFITSQLTLESITHPISFYLHFIKSPILNHNSEIMNKLRFSMQNELNTALLAYFPNLNTQLLSTNIEKSIYQYNFTIKNYLYVFALLFVILSEKTIYELSSFSLLVSNNRLDISAIGKLSSFSLHDILQLFFPQFISIPSPLLSYFNNKISFFSRKFGINAFFLQYPMQRIPYLNNLIYSFPLNIVFSPPHLNFNFDLDIINLFVFKSPDESNPYLIQNTITISSDIIIPSIPSSNPLQNFIQLAFEKLDKL